MLYPDFNDLISLKAKAPRLLFNSNRMVISNAIGDYRSPFRGQGLEFEEVREYSHGDDIRSIDWRVTARTDSPHTKVFKEERERSVMLCIDVNNSMRFGTKNTFKSVQAARCAALLGWQASNNNDRFGACLFGDVKDGIKFIAFKRSRTSLWAAFKALSDTAINQYKESVNLDDVLVHINKAVPTGALIYIISDFAYIGENLEQQLGKLRRRCDVVLITIDDAADQIILPVGTVLFSCKEEKIYVNTDSKQGREFYTRQWQVNRKVLQDITTKLGIGLLSLNTDSNIHKELAFGLRKITLGRRTI